MDLREQIEAHVEFLKELGIEGTSRDARWRRREGDPLPESRSPETTEPDPPAAPPGEALAPGDGRRDLQAAEPPAARAPGEWAPGERTQGRTSAATAGVEHVESVPAAFGPQMGEPGSDGTETLEDICRDLGDCTRCKLHRLGRHKIVFGAGNPRAELMFVGEGPGHDEDLQGIPFVGRAGQLLTKMIAAIDLSRDDVYIANVVKCRPPENRAPEPDETAACQPFLVRQVRAVRPKVLVALGASAARTLLDWKGPVSRLRGRTYDYAGSRLVVTYHPAYLLRNPASKREAWEDLKLVRKLLGEDSAR